MILMRKTTRYLGKIKTYYEFYRQIYVCKNVNFNNPTWMDIKTILSFNSELEKNCD